MVGKGLAVLKFHAPVVAKSGFRSRFAGVALALATLATGWSGAASAEPSQDLLTKLNELNKKVEQLSQTINAAQADFDNKMRVLAEADAKQEQDLAALEGAKVRLADYQRGVDKIAAAVEALGRRDRALCASDTRASSAATSAVTANAMRIVDFRIPPSE